MVPPPRSEGSDFGDLLNYTAWGETLVEWIEHGYCILEIQWQQRHQGVLGREKSPSLTPDTGKCTFDGVARWLSACTGSGTYFNYGYYTFAPTLYRGTLAPRKKENGRQSSVLSI